jgi:hypothetical protein
MVGYGNQAIYAKRVFLADSWEQAIPSNGIKENGSGIRGGVQRSNGTSPFDSMPFRLGLMTTGSGEIGVGSSTIGT